MQLNLLSVETGELHCRMNDGYLLADCVFDSLINISFIHPADWKHNTKELYYTASFIIVGTRASRVFFEVTVLNGTHRIAKSSLRLQGKRFTQNFETIFSACTIN